MIQPILRPAALAAALILAACSASQTGTGQSVVPSASDRHVQDGFGSGPPLLNPRLGKLPARVVGRVVNAQGNPVVSATVVAYNLVGNVVTTSLTAADGTFTIALLAGTYNVAILNRYTSASGGTVVAQGATSANGPTVPVVVVSSALIDLGTLSD